MTGWQEWKDRNVWWDNVEGVGLLLRAALLSPILLLLLIWYWLKRRWEAYGQG